MNFMILTFLKTGEITQVHFGTIEAANQVFFMPKLPTVVYSALYDIRGADDIELATWGD